MPSAAETVDKETAKGSPGAAPATKETVEQKTPATPPAVAPKVEPATPAADSKEAPKPEAEKLKGRTILTSTVEEKKPEEVKPDAAEKKPEAPKAEELKLELPKDSRLDPKDVEQTLALAKEHGLNQKQAEAALERQHVAVQAHHDRLLSDHEKRVTGWAEELKNDPEFGGANFLENSKDAQMALTKLFPKLTASGKLDVTGFGNDPDLVKDLAALGKLIKNDKTVFGGSKVQTELPSEKILFGPDGK